MYWYWLSLSILPHTVAIPRTPTLHAKPAGLAQRLILPIVVLTARAESQGCGLYQRQRCRLE